MLVLYYPFAPRSPGLRMRLVIAVPMLCGSWRVKKVPPLHQGHMPVDAKNIVTLPMRRRRFHMDDFPSGVGDVVDISPRGHIPLSRYAVFGYAVYGIVLVYPPSRIRNGVHFTRGYHGAFERGGLRSASQSKIPQVLVCPGGRWGTLPTLTNDSTVVIGITGEDIEHRWLWGDDSAIGDIAGTVPRPVCPTDRIIRLDCIDPRLVVGPNVARRRVLLQEDRWIVSGLGGVHCESKPDLTQVVFATGRARVGFGRGERWQQEGREDPDGGDDD